jgi:alpha-beta hydrolase superfamily lysophospholipase
LRHTAYDGAAHEVFNETNKDAVLAEVSNFLRETLQLD